VAVFSRAALPGWVLAATVRSTSVLSACNALSGVGDLNEIGASGGSPDCGSPDGSPADGTGDARSEAASDSSEASCSANLGSDPNNCGACGHGCLGGNCVAGACQPILLAAGPPGAEGIAVDAVNVYWTVSVPSAGAVDQVGILGGSPLTLASHRDTPFSVVAIGADVYFTEYGTALSKVPVGGGDTTVIDPGITSSTRHLTHDGAAFYWTNEAAGVVTRLPFGASGDTPFVIGQSIPAGLVIDAQSAYWVNAGAGTVATAPIAYDGGAGQVLATGSANPLFLTADATTLYWTTEVGGEVLSVPKSGGAVTTIAVGQGNPHGIVVDGPHLYWVNHGDGLVMRAPSGGGSATVLAMGQQGPMGLAVDAVSLYWTNSVSGTVMRLAK
jgi:sugar lactone lactonase YvrE